MFWEGRGVSVEEQWEWSFFSTGRNSLFWRGVGSKSELGGLWPGAVRFCAPICVLGGGVQDTERPGSCCRDKGGLGHQWRIASTNSDLGESFRIFEAGASLCIKGEHSHLPRSQPRPVGKP